VLENTQHILYKHITWIEQLIIKYGTSQSREFAEDLVRNEVGNIFLAVLSDAGVYKNNAAGTNAFRSFMLHLGCCEGEKM
jgi:UDPglucose--hexose-1-phosphate uridylyltransferase